MDNQNDILEGAKTAFINETYNLQMISNLNSFQTTLIIRF